MDTMTIISRAITIIIAMIKIEPIVIPMDIGGRLKEGWQEW